MLGRKQVKVFISIPFQGRTDADIEASIIKFGNRLREEFVNYDIKILHNFIHRNPPSGIPSVSVWYLGQALCVMAEADFVAYIPGIVGYRGCEMEKQVARSYNIKLLAFGTVSDICPDLVPKK